MIDPARYCRDIETYLCQKNDGHLVRIVGPAFEQVCGWAERGVPLRVAYRGIDRYFERYYAKGGRRRPVRIEFCEADILDAFDEWRRAVGVTGGVDNSSEAAESNRKPALVAHIERALRRLRAVDAAGSLPRDLQPAIQTAMGELERLIEEARTARGEKRGVIIGRLSALDEALTRASLAATVGANATELRREAESELAPFGARMAPDVRQSAVEAAFHRLIRQAFGLPSLGYE